MKIEDLTVVFDKEEQNFRVTAKADESLRDKEIAEQFGLELHIYQELIGDEDSAYQSFNKNIYFDEEEGAECAIDELKYYLKRSS